MGTGFWLRAFLYLLVIVGASPRSATADGIDDFRGSWTGRALAAQRLLDLGTPLRDVNFVGAHNAFNSDAYSSALRYFDTNQRHTIFNLLRLGVRVVEFDVHWTPKTEGFTFQDRLLLCHGTASHIGCSLSDRYFTEGLEEIAAWLGTADSIGQVLLLHIEDHMDGRHGEAFNEVNSRIGSRVYSSGGCRDVPGDLTKAGILAAGKNVIIWNEGGCSGDGNWNSMVFTGLGDLSRVWEDTTALGGGSVPPIGGTEVASYFAGGGNIVDLDQVDENDGRWGAAVWSWDLGEPNDVGGEDCAVQIANGRWNDADCNQQYQFACENMATGGWAVTGITGPWGGGGLACRALGPDYRFSVPTNSLDNQLLNEARIRSGHDTAWLNHDDRAREGEWVSKDSEDLIYGSGAFRLGAGEAVRGKSRMLRMETNCNLVLYSLAGAVVGGGLWSSGTANEGTNCRLEFQNDGNLVIYEGGGRALWHASTSGSELRLQADGNLVVYDSGGGALWSTHTAYGEDVVVSAGQFLMTGGQILHSANRKLVMGGDCSLSLFAFENGVTGGLAWSSQTAGIGDGCHLDFQADGNLVLYDKFGLARWASGTSGTVGAQLRMQADGNVVIYNGANEPLWSTFSNWPAEAERRGGGFSLAAGQYLQTQTRKLELQDDCDLVLSSVDNFVVGGVLWRSNTAGAGAGCRVDFQADGNLVLHDGQGAARWAAGTSGTVDARLRLQSDGNLVIYNTSNEPLWTTHTALPNLAAFSAGQFALVPGQFVRLNHRLLELHDDCQLALYELENALPRLRIWDSNTAGAGTGCRLDFQSDGNLVLYDGDGRSLWDSGTSGTSGAQLKLQPDGNMVLYNGADEALWTSQTPGNYSHVALCEDAMCNGSEACSSCASDCGPCCVCGDGLVETACGEQCDNGVAAGGSCCSASCLLEAAGTPCRAASGVCDVAETCDGAGPVCPDDAKAGSGTPCRTATGACDVAEQCDGSSADCPEDGYRSDGSSCDDGDECTIIDVCTGGLCSGDPSTCGDGVLQSACGEQCDDGGVVGGDGCDEACVVELCPGEALRGCHEVERAKLHWDEKRPGREQFRMQWKMIRENTTQAELGDPVGGPSAVALCLYDDAGRLIEGFEVDRGGELCGLAPCWEARASRGYRYRDKGLGASGVQQISFAAGKPGRGKVEAKGRNIASEGKAFLPAGVVGRLAGQTRPTMQFVTDGGFCVTATITGVRSDDGLQFKAEKR